MDKHQPSDISPEAESIESTQRPHPNDPGFTLRVSDDSLEAYITPMHGADSGITPDALKEFLKIQGISYGIVDDALIAEYLAAQPLAHPPWKVAVGKAPQAGSDPEIRCHFDTQPLKIGTVTKSGRIDYKDRGEIPQVKKGTLIAEKIPGTLGVAGMDVYGQTIPSPRPRDITFLAGSGVERSEDGFRLYAKIDGRPELSEDGRFSVSPLLQISGDVGLETGHIDFDGHIEVRGCVQEGFRIRGGSLRAKEILKADIEIAGDIIVSGGVIGSHITIGGKLSAVYIHNAHIRANGAIEVEREIFSSTIESNDICNIIRGKIVASTITARQGIATKEIGSETSPPSTLTVGIDTATKYQIKKFNEQIAEKKEDQTKLKTLADELQREFAVLNEEIEAIPQEEDLARIQQMTLQKKLEDLRKLNDPAQTAKLQGAIAYLDTKIRQLQETAESLLERQDRITEKIALVHGELTTSEEEAADLRDEIDAVTERSQTEKGDPTVKVSGTIRSATQIIGPHTSFTADEDYHHVVIKEVKITQPDAPVTWSIDISPFK